ncbi:MAG: hypothetical protein HYV60_06370 [Planctomycetia bacterium]|nr:hypothetical protein [Planctomycetia bacterium]
MQNRLRRCLQRLVSLLSPPIATPLTLLLYDVEASWFAGYAVERRKAHHKRRGSGSRSDFFPQFDGWRTPNPPGAVDVEAEQSLRDFESVEADVFDAYKARIYRTNHTTEAGDNVPARLVLFVGGAYGFFTNTYKLHVVTHLIEGAFNEDDDKLFVSSTPVKKLQLGDAIVFRKSSRDVIRDVADTILPPGIRELSATWRRAILSFVKRNGLNSEQLGERLRHAGCKVQQQAIEGWLRYDDMIAPQAYRRDVPAIAKATDDEELKNS